jgi:hypothetical protein
MKQPGGAAQKGRQVNIGVQLYSVRSAMAALAESHDYLERLR